MAFEDLPKPANYTLQVPDPTESVRKNLELAMGLQQSQRQAQAFQTQQQLHGFQMQEIQQKLGQQQMAQQRAIGYHQALAAAPPTPEGIAAVAKAYPEQGEETERLFKLQNETQQRAALSILQPINAAMLSNQPDVVKAKITEARAAYANAPQPRPDDVKKMDDLQAMYDKDPVAAAKYTGVTIAHALGPDKFQENLKTLGELPNALGIQEQKLKQEKVATSFAQPQAEATLAKTGAETDSAQSTANKNQQTIEEEKKKFPIELRQLQKAADSLPKEDKEVYNAEGVSAQTNQVLSNKLGTLIKGLDTTKITPGVAGYIQDQWKSIWGNQGKAQELRQQYSQIANASALEQLRGAGRMTQGEIDLIMTGLPGKYASAANIKAFLTAMKNATDAKKELSAENMRWIAANQGTGPAVKDITVDGLTYKKGSIQPGIAAPQVRPEFLKQALQHLNDPKADPARRALYRSELEKRGIVIPNGQPTS